MTEILTAFGTGNAAILQNACLLPLYPGLIAFLAGNAGNERARKGIALLGVLVLAGILTMMVVIGFILSLLRAQLGDTLTILLPIIYLFVIAMGGLMLIGRNPFARLSTAQAPMLRNPYVTAYVYGLFFGPMTLPCTGPLIIGTFAYSAGNIQSIFDGLTFFFFFGLGFGWPLVVLPLAAMPVQRRIVSWLAQHHDVMTRASGVLLVAVGVFGFITELLPHIDPAFIFSLEAQIIYWIVAAGITIGAGYAAYRALHTPHADDVPQMAET